MYTRNFYKIFAGWVASGGHNQSGGYYGLGCSLIATDGTEITDRYFDDSTSSWVVQSCFATVCEEIVTTQFKRGWVFGTGTTPPSIDDYWLSGSQITTVRKTNATESNVVLESGIELISTIGLENTGTSEITISEIGFVTNTNYTSVSSTKPPFLVFRDVLDTPLVLKPGESGHITINRTIAIPTA